MGCLDCFNIYKKYEIYYLIVICYIATYMVVEESLRLIITKSVYRFVSLRERKSCLLLGVELKFTPEIERKEFYGLP